jgi:hypothetical protein
MSHWLCNQKSKAVTAENAEICADKRRKTLKLVLGG